MAAHTRNSSLQGNRYILRSYDTSGYPPNMSVLTLPAEESQLKEYNLAKDRRKKVIQTCITKREILGII